MFVCCLPISRSWRTARPQSSSTSIWCVYNQFDIVLIFRWLDFRLRSTANWLSNRLLTNFGLKFYAFRYSKSLKLICSSKLRFENSDYRTKILKKMNDLMTRVYLKATNHKLTNSNWTLDWLTLYPNMKLKWICLSWTRFPAMATLFNFSIHA